MRSTPWPARGPSEHRPRARESRFRPPAAGAVRAVGLCQNRDQRRGDRAQLARQEGPQRLSDGRSAGLARVRGGAVERRLLSARVRPRPHGAAPGRLPRSGRRRERSARPRMVRPIASMQVASSRIGEGALDHRIEVTRKDELGDARRRVQQDGRAAAGVLRGPGGEGRGADTRAGDGAGRDRREEPPARDRQPAQVGVPGQHVARAAHAAERDHRLLRGAARADVRRAERASRTSTCEDILERRPPPAVADQRHPRPLEGRGGADGARARRRSTCRDALESGADDAARAGQPRSGIALDADASTPRRDRSSQADERKISRSCSTCSPTPSSSRPTGGRVDVPRARPTASSRSRCRHGRRHRARRTRSRSSRSSSRPGPRTAAEHEGTGLGLALRGGSSSCTAGGSGSRASWATAAPSASRCPSGTAS